MLLFSLSPYLASSNRSFLVVKLVLYSLKCMVYLHCSSIGSASTLQLYLGTAGSFLEYGLGALKGALDF